MKAIKVFRSNVRRSRKMLRLYDAQVRQGRSHESVDDLLRSCLVLAVSSFDAYIHESIANNMVEFVKRNISIKSKRQNLSSFEETVKGLFSPMDYLAMLTRKRPYVQVRKKVEEKLFEKSFQSPDKVANALQLFGITRFWGDLASSGKGRGNLAIEAPSLLEQLSERRNNVVHEMDRHRSKKKKHDKKKISRKDCSAALDLVTFLANYIENTYLVLGLIIKVVFSFLLSYRAAACYGNG